MGKMKTVNAVICELADHPLKFSDGTACNTCTYAARRLILISPDVPTEQRLLAAFEAARLAYGPDAWLCVQERFAGSPQPAR